MRMDVSDLRLFLAIVKAGSITHGAAITHLALGSASERIRNLETDVGVKLLERHARGVWPTEAGEALANHARLILQQQEKMRSELEDFARGLTGTLRLYTNTAALISLLPQKLPPWLKERPALQINLQERPSHLIVQSIQAGIVEGGIISDATDSKDLCQDMIAPDPLVVIIPKHHPLSAYKRLCFADITAFPMVGLTEESAFQIQLEEQACKLGVSLALRIRLKGFDELCQMVSHQIGIAVIPRVIAQRWRKRYSFATASLTDHWANRNLCLCYRDAQSLSPATASLFSHLRTA